MLCPYPYFFHVLVMTLYLWYSACCGLWVGLLFLEGAVVVVVVGVLLVGGVMLLCCSWSCVGLSFVAILIPLSGPLCIPVSWVYLLRMVVLWCVRAFCVLKM